MGKPDRPGTGSDGEDFPLGMFNLKDLLRRSCDALAVTIGLIGGDVRAANQNWESSADK